VPIGAVLARGAAAAVFKPGNHGTTFGGNPLATRAALETLATIEADGLMRNAERIGAQIREGLLAGLSERQGFVEIRGRGLMLGLELDVPCGELVQAALDLPGEHGMLINVTQERVVRLLPPLIMNSREADQLVAGLVQIISEFLARQHPHAH
jgi:acetylornithine aminotransferase